MPASNSEARKRRSDGADHLWAPPVATISKYVEMDTGHRVPMHASKCSNPHGHRYRVTAFVEGPILPPRGETDDGMVVDFGDIKALLTEHVHDVYDHAFVVWQYDEALLDFLHTQGWRYVSVPFVPTAECMAQHFYDVLAPRLGDRGLHLVAIEVQETPSSIARYQPEVRS